MAGKRLIAQPYNESLHISKKDTKENAEGAGKKYIPSTLSGT